MFGNMLNMVKTWWKGKEGEGYVKSILNSLPENDYLCLHDLTYQSTYERDNQTVSRTVQIDHLLLSLKTGAVFVIETKNVTGELIGDVDAPNWMLRNPNRDMEVQNYFRQNFGHVKTVQNILQNEIGFFPNELINSLVFVVPDKQGSQHSIHRNPEKAAKQKGNDWFDVRNLVSDVESFQNYLEFKNESALNYRAELKEKGIKNSDQLSGKEELKNALNNSKMDFSPMKMRQLAKILSDKSMSGIITDIKHIHNVKNIKSQKQEYGGETSKERNFSELKRKKSPSLK